MSKGGQDEHGLLLVLPMSALTHAAKDSVGASSVHNFFDGSEAAGEG